MKKVKILHNPGAGEGETTKRRLLEMIEAEGFKCSYSSTKDFSWENIESKDYDLVILAGGDGTVRKIAEELLHRKVIARKIPLGLLPMGTANNIAKTLGLSGEEREIVAGWRNGITEQFDIGTIEGGGKPDFFLESFGFGLFPKLMQQMRKRKKEEISDPKKKIRAALKLLHELTLCMPLKECKLEVDGQDHSGEYLLVEVMNIRSIGPNLHLAPDARIGDGRFDIVLISEDQRQRLADYVQQKIDGKEFIFDFPVLHGKELKIQWKGKHVHVDDQYIKLEEPEKVKVRVREAVLDFLIPAADAHKPR